MTNDIFIDDVLCASDSEVEIGIEKDETLDEVIERGNRALDKACCTSLFVVKCSDETYRIGEFSFDFREVSKEEAEKVAREFASEEANG